MKPEFEKLKALEGKILLCPDGGRLYYVPSDDAYMLVTSDSDSQPATEKALKLIREATSKNVEAESEIGVDKDWEEVANFASKEFESWDPEVRQAADAHLIEGSDRIMTRSELAAYAHQAATSPKNDLPHPSPAQIARGNYRKGHIKVAGFDIAIENPEGSERQGVDPQSGKPWKTKMTAHYGYIKRSSGADGDHVDCFVKPGIASDHAGPIFVIHQNDADGNFDEHKCMLGYADEDEAKDAYLAHYDAKQKKRIARVEAMSPCAFKGWLDSDGPLMATVVPAGLTTSSTYGDPPQTDELIEDEEIEELVIVDEADEVEIAACDARDGLCTIRQRVTRVDAMNKNRRIYRRAVMNAAIDKLNLLAAAGSVLSEKGHPPAVNICDRGACGVSYIDGGPSVKTGRWTSLEHADADGWVFGTRVILDTPAGREIKAKIDSKKPIAVSSRMFLEGKDTMLVNGIKAHVPSVIIFSTIDDVDVPAVEGTGIGYQVLSSAAIDEIEANYNSNLPDAPAPASSLTDEAHCDSSPTTKRVPALEPEKEMSNLIALLRAFRSKTKAPVASADEVNAAHAAVADRILADYREGANSDEFRSVVREYRKIAADAEQIPGYRGGATGPTAQLANELGDDPLSGWGASELINGSGGERYQMGAQPTTPISKTMATADATPETEEQKKVREFTLKQMAQDEAREKKVAHDAAVDERINEIMGDGNHPLHKMSAENREGVLKAVRLSAPSVDSVSTLIDALVAPISAAAADATLAATGARGIVRGQTTHDPSNPIIAMIPSGTSPMMAGVDKLMTAYDEHMRSNPSAADEAGWIDPELNPGEQTRRDRIKAKILPIAEGYTDALLSRAGIDGASAVDAFGEESLWNDLRQMTASDAVAYSSIVSSFYNQPTIAMWLLVQSFQDMRFLDFFTCFGPGQSAASGIAGWEAMSGFGRVVKVPSETYSDPSGYNGTLGMPFDLNVAENAGIAPGTVKIFWDTFFAAWRKIAATLSIEAINAIGRGPLNYPAVVRALWHMAARKSRGVDTLLGNEMMAAALEFGAVGVVAESYTNGGANGLDTNSNSSQPSSGAVSVNLNPQKTATAAIAASDKSVTYGTGNATGGVAVASALRLRCGGGNGATGGTYCSLNITGPTPVVPPRALTTLDTNGADSLSTLNAIAITAPVSQVLGYLGKDGNIYSAPGTTATYAVDYLNGVIVFIAGQTTRSGAIFTTTVTLGYAYATNFDYFVLGHRNVGQVTLATGETIQDYYGKALGQLDISASVMGQSPNFVKPDLAVMGLGIAARLIQAKVFYKLNSPDGTELFPDETFFARRNGVNLARVNAPCWWVDDAMVITRKGTGKYAIDTPAEIRGPITLFDSNGLPIAGEAYYLAENSAIFTAQVKNQSGVVVNAVSRALIFY